MMHPKIFGKIKHLHFVGIGGAGMGGIAEVLHNLGYKVSGSDNQRNTMVDHLESLNIKIYQEHAIENIENADALVISSAIPDDNPERLEALQKRLPIVPRALMLAELMRFKLGIAIAGAHGKTTTTSLVSCILTEAGLDPTFVIGGKLNSLKRHAKLGSGEYFVAEADESDASFLHLMPCIAIVTNIDQDHLGTYEHDFNKLKQTYLQFLHRLPFYGIAVLCGEDPEIQQLMPDIARPTITYGFSEDQDVFASNIQLGQWSSRFTLNRKQKPPLDILLNLPGKHNILNALAAITVAIEAGISDAVIQQALHKFAGVGRRLQSLGTWPIEDKKIPVIDDYGHHPNEIKAVLETLRASWPEQRIVMVFQPHRYSRTRDLFEDFANVLSQVDVLVLLEVYSAGEDSISGADGRSLARAIRARSRIEPVFLDDKSVLFETLENILQAHDVLILQGAGDIGNLAQQLEKNINTKTC
ncbi:MAG: UDP-N-acetylmuramate--L-alanine ligase [Gammaproteobacteria bacterium]